MELICTAIDNILLIKIHGKLIQKNVPAFRDFVLPRLKNCRHLIFDLEEMVKIDHYGMNAILYVQLQALNQGLKVKLARILPGPRVLFDITEAYQVFDIFETTDTALATCRKEQP